MAASRVRVCPFPACSLWWQDAREFLTPCVRPAPYPPPPSARQAAPPHSHNTNKHTGYSNAYGARTAKYLPTTATGTLLGIVQTAAELRCIHSHGRNGGMLANDTQ